MTRKLRSFFTAGHPPRWAVAGGVLTVAGAIVALFTLGDVGNGPSRSLGFVSPTATLIPIPSPTPTPAPPTRTPVPPPTATPTITYLTVVATPSPNVIPALNTHAQTRSWSPQQRALLIDQDAQEIYVYMDGRKIKTIPCSTGKPLLDHFTPAWIGRVGPYQGTIFSFGVYADDAWYLFRASGDILIHGAPYVYVNGKKVYQDLDALGRYPSSHGCIRIHPADAKWLTEWNIEGVPIIVLPYHGGFVE